MLVMLYMFLYMALIAKLVVNLNQNQLAPPVFFLLLISIEFIYETLEADIRSKQE